MESPGCARARVPKVGATAVEEKRRMPLGERRYNDNYALLEYQFLPRTTVRSF